jgi:hypothetical protein
MAGLENAKEVGKLPVDVPADVDRPGKVENRRLLEKGGDDFFEQPADILAEKVEGALLDEVLDYGVQTEIALPVRGRSVH